MDSPIRFFARGAAFGLALLGASACSTHPVARTGGDAASLASASQVNITDGIDVREAQLLASAYFHRHISGCGYVGIPQRRGHRWIARAFAGYAGTPRGIIEIDDRTGAASWKDAAAPPGQRPASQAAIVEGARQLIVQREKWTYETHLTAAQDPIDRTWRVTANAVDPRHTKCACVLFVPGTGRELLFAPTGTLIGYY
jgi:hypothetical protein